jgi:hypothetical protein
MLTPRRTIVASSTVPTLLFALSVHLPRRSSAKPVLSATKSAQTSVLMTAVTESWLHRRRATMGTALAMTVVRVHVHSNPNSTA